MLTIMPQKGNINIISKQRDITFDIMKGISILLMMIGHSAWLPEWLHRGIYSFHMPLFFIVAGYFSYARAEGSDSFFYVASKYFKKLVIPYIVVSCTNIVLGIIQCGYHHSFEQIPHVIIGYSFCLDTYFEGTIFDSYPAPIWFLLALFWAKLTFWSISKWQRFLLPISFLISFSAVLIHSHIPMPWGIAEGLQGVVFLTLGYYWKNRQNYLENKFFQSIQIGLIVLWIIMLPWGRIDMVFLKYFFFPLDLLAATGGTMVIYYVSRVILHVSGLSKALAWCGKNSLYILCVHTIDMSCPIIHFALKKLHVDMAPILYYGLKHSLTIAGSAVYCNTKSMLLKKKA